MLYSPNYAFLIDTIVRESGQSARVLDYGCGAGEVVEAGRKRGLDMVGADIFQTEDDRRAAHVRAGRLGLTIFDIVDGRLPFADESFDAICSNQVFEHVENLDLVLSEIARVLKPGGVLLAIYPTSETWREGHCGVVFAHWLCRFPRLQVAWLLAARTLGFGHFKEGRSRIEWATGFRDYMRLYTFYRPMAELISAHERHIGKVERREVELAAYHLGRNPPLPAPLVRWFFAVAANIVTLTRKPQRETIRRAA